MTSFKIPVCIVAILALICSVCHCEDDARQPSMFKAGDEWLALPEVFSNLDFTADSTPAKEDDIDGQIRLRSTRFWGRLYIDGWPQTIQFFRAHFGIDAPMGRKTFVFAEPRDACGDLSNAEHLTSDHIVFVHRGTCTFGTKAKNVEKAGAAGIVIINNEPGLDHLPGPDAHDIQFFVSSIAQQEGALLEAVYDEGPRSGPNGVFGRKLEGYVVPINCENSGARCVPATYRERNQISTMVEGGTLTVNSKADPKKSLLKAGDEPLEYLLAHFGTMVLDSSSALPVTVAKPAEACTPLENDVKGKIVLVRRGNCPFVKKAEEIQAAGGRAMVVGSIHPYILRMGVEPRWKGLNTAIPVVMVSKRTYSILVAESYNPDAVVAFHEDAAPADNAPVAAAFAPVRVNGEAWEPLEKLAKGEGWPRSSLYVTKKYQELKATYQGWPDRLLALEDAYAAKLKEDSAGANEAVEAAKEEL